jgi:lipopolysaccharide transport system ATP-binding protein
MSSNYINTVSYSGKVPGDDTDNFAIRVQGLSKCYQLYDKPRDRLKQFFIPYLKSLAGQNPTQYFHEFWALKDISFEIKRGETIGIIGCNGAGKSTLLQIICGTLTPTTGTVETRGRIAALLELGSGFNSEFTGRENIYMNAAVLGLSKDEVDNRFDDIASFADIDQFIDQPVKNYSSGMILRLAFAVQSQLDPDILIVDEALSVGDAKFQVKCFERLRQLKENGTSILLVTHDNEQIVSHCSSAILLNNGVQLVIGEPRNVINRYMDILFNKERKKPEDKIQDNTCDKIISFADDSTYTLSSQEDLFLSRPGYNKHEYRWGDGSVSILDFYLAADGEPYPSTVVTKQKILLAASLIFYKDLYRPILGITIKTKEGITVYGVNSEMLDCKEFQVSGQKLSVVCVEAKFKCGLAPGDYFISLGVSTKHGEEIIPHDRRYDAIHVQVRPNSGFFGLINLELNLNAKPII